MTVLMVSTAMLISHRYAIVVNLLARKSMNVLQLVGEWPNKYRIKFHEMLPLKFH